MTIYKPIYLQKALKYKAKSHANLLKGRWIQEKLDGVGAQILLDEKGVRIFAMSTAEKSKVFTEWTAKLPHLVEEFSLLRIYGSTTDEPFYGIIQGELYVDYFEPGNPNFGFVTGTLHADDALERQEVYKIKFLAYELPTDPMRYSSRYEILEILFNTCSEGYGIEFKYIGLNPILGVNRTGKELETCFNEIVSHGREGVVLYDPNCLYKHSESSCQRNKGLIKIKSETEAEVLCVEMVEGEGKYFGTLGAMICQDAEGRTFHIGSFGVNDVERFEIWSTMTPPFLVEMTYFEQTDKSYKLPRFKRVRLDKSIADWNKVDRISGMGVV